MNTSAFRKILISLGLLVVVIGTPLLVAYTMGFRIDKSLTISRGSAITLQNLESNLQIYLDGRPAKTTASSTEERLRFLPAGEHEVLVAKEGHWPWMKKVSLQGGQLASLAPFSVPVSLPVDDFFPAHPMYPTVSERFKSIQPPNEESPRISISDKVSLYVSGTDIYAMLRDTENPPAAFCKPECVTRLKVFSGRSPITQADFFKGRDDVILFAMDDGIYAIELDTEDRQNFQPIFKGTHPNFIVNSATSLYIQDDNRYGEIVL